MPPPIPAAMAAAGGDGRRRRELLATLEVRQHRFAFFDRDSLRMALQEAAGSAAAGTPAARPDPCAELEKVYGLLSDTAGAPVSQPGPAAALLRCFSLDDMARRFSRLTSRRKAVAHPDALFLDNLRVALQNLRPADVDKGMSSFRKGAAKKPPGETDAHVSDGASSCASTAAEAGCTHDTEDFSEVAEAIAAEAADHGIGGTQEQQPAASDHGQTKKLQQPQVGELAAGAGLAAQDKADLPHEAEAVANGASGLTITPCDANSQHPDAKSKHDEASKQAKDRAKMNPAGDKADQPQRQWLQMPESQSQESAATTASSKFAAACKIQAFVRGHIARSAYDHYRTLTRRKPAQRVKWASIICARGGYRRRLPAFHSLLEGLAGLQVEKQGKTKDGLVGPLF